MKYHILQNHNIEDLWVQLLGGKLLKEISGCIKMEIIAHLGVISGKLMPLGEFITGDTVGEVEIQENWS